jgi:hypothetical protein
MPPAMTDDIERFVRDGLGCGCPAEVFQSIAVERLPAIAGRPPMVRLVVGSRLLIHVVAPPVGTAAPGWIEQLAAHGRAARDHHGYQRFRLVIAAPGTQESAGEIRSRFARAVAGDERMHLHFVVPDALPARLEWPGAPVQSSVATRTVAK